MTERAVNPFGGPGGWDVACAELGIRVIGIEIDRWACATRAAAGHLTIRADVAAYPPEVFAGYDGLIASPPCQAFSKAGKRRGIADQSRLFHHIAVCRGGWTPEVGEAPWHDARSPLVLEVLRWAWAIRPTWIACEQVPDVLPLWQAMCRVLRGWGYSAWAGRLNAECYGVPQTRERAILMARNDGIPAEPPAPTHQEYRPAEPAWTESRAGLYGSLRPWISMAEALGWGMTERPGLTIAPGHADALACGGSGARAVAERERERGAWAHPAHQPRAGTGRTPAAGADRPSRSHGHGEGGRSVVPAP